MNGGSSRNGSRVKILRASEIAAQPIEWLWPGWIARGKLTILAGNGGDGKSTVAIALASVVTAGGLWPDGTPCTRKGRVVMWSGEDDVADTLKPRFMAAGADLANVHFVVGDTMLDGGSSSFDPSTDIKKLELAIDSIGGAELLIIDPIVLAVRGDMNKANIVRRDLQAIVDLAASRGCAVLGISHFSKGNNSSGSPTSRVIGSQAFSALARTVLLVGKDESSDRRVMMRSKSNISSDVGGVSYAIEPKIVREMGAGNHDIEAVTCSWGAYIDANASQIMRSLDSNSCDDTSAFGRAKQFLISQLVDGPKAAIEIEQAASAARFSEATIRRAKSALDIRSRKGCMDGGWVWGLPQDFGLTETYSH